MNDIEERCPFCKGKLRFVQEYTRKLELNERDYEELTDDQQTDHDDEIENDSRDDGNVQIRLYKCTTCLKLTEFQING